MQIRTDILNFREKIKSDLSFSEIFWRKTQADLTLTQEFERKTQNLLEKYVKNTNHEEIHVKMCVKGVIREREGNGDCFNIEFQ